MTDRDGKDVDTGTPPERYRADNRIGCKHTTVPFELHDDPDIDAFGLAVYSALLTAADFGTGRNAWPSRGTLADRAGCAERAVDGRLDVLNRRGWISRQPRKGKTTLYTVHFTRRMDAEYTPAGDAAVDETPAGDAGVPLQEMRTPLQEMQGTPAADADDRAPFTKHPSQHPSTKQEVESEGCADRDEVETENGAFRGGDGAGPDISASSDPPGLFERFLEEYPFTKRPVKRRTCQDQWDQAIAGGATAESLIASAKGYSLSVEDTDPKYRKSPSNFLREGMWREYDTDGRAMTFRERVRERSRGARHYQEFDLEERLRKELGDRLVDDHIREGGLEVVALQLLKEGYRIEDYSPTPDRPGAAERQAVA